MAEYIERRHYDKRNNPNQSSDEIFAVDANNILGLTRGAGLSATEENIIGLMRRPTERFEGEKGKLIEEVLKLAEISPEQLEWLGQLRTRFDSLQQLHTGIEWSEVEKALKANPESMARLLVLDAAGHKMNVFAEEGDEFVFVSAWDQVGEVSEDHRYICYDAEGERLAKEQGYSPRGNAVGIIMKAFNLEDEKEAEKYLADPRYHEKLRQAISVTGGAWLKTDENIRETGYAFLGDDFGIYRDLARYHNGSGSFRAALRVKKA